MSKFLVLTQKGNYHKVLDEHHLLELVKELAKELEVDIEECINFHIEIYEFYEMETVNEKFLKIEKMSREDYIHHLTQVQNWEEEYVGSGMSFMMKDFTDLNGNKVLVVAHTNGDSFLMRHPEEERFIHKKEYTEGNKEEYDINGYDFGTFKDEEFEGIPDFFFEDLFDEKTVKEIKFIKNRFSHYERELFM